MTPGEYRAHRLCVQKFCPKLVAMATSFEELEKEVQIDHLRTKPIIWCKDYENRLNSENCLICDNHPLASNIVQYMQCKFPSPWADPDLIQYKTA